MNVLRNVTSRPSVAKQSGNSNIHRLRPLVGLLAAALCFSELAAAQSLAAPSYTPGLQTNGSYVLGDGQIITPAGTQVNLGVRVRAKAIALNPTGNHTAAVLTMGTSSKNGNGAVEVFNTLTGAVLQSYSVGGADSHGSNLGISYTPDGQHLLFSQDNSFVAVASVSAAGLLADYAHVPVPIDATVVSVPGLGNVDVLNTVTCFPSSPVGTTGSSAVPCGIPISQGTSYPTGIAVAPDGKTAYVVLNANNTLAKIDLTQATPVEVTDIRVGNVPHSVVISADGKTAYVSNEAGRIATASDFQEISDGTPVVADPVTGATSTGTVSVVDLASFKVTGSISTGLHPTGMAFWGKKLLVANAYSDSVTIIDTADGNQVSTLPLALPIGIPGAEAPAYGAGPNSIAVDARNGVAYLSLIHI